MKRLIALACVGLCVGSAHRRSRRRIRDRAGLVVVSDTRIAQDRATIRGRRPRRGVLSAHADGAARDAIHCSSPRWSSDGRRILFVGCLGYLCRRVGWSARNDVPDTRDGSRDPRRSGTPIGRRTVRRSCVTRGDARRPSCTDLYVKRLDAGPATRLTTSAACERHPRGRRTDSDIAFESQAEASVH